MKSCVTYVLVYVEVMRETEQNVEKVRERWHQLLGIDEEEEQHRGCSAEILQPPAKTKGDVNGDDLLQFLSMN